jgi:hypothetical protein
LFGLCSEWAVNIQRDSYASYVGHYPLLAYFAVAENESIGREKYNFMQVIVSSVLKASLGIQTGANCHTRTDKLIFLSVSPFPTRSRPLLSDQASELVTNMCRRFDNEVVIVLNCLRFVQKMLLPCGLPPEKDED